VARNPPPDKLNPTEFGIFAADGKKLATVMDDAPLRAI
jgi:hypothetical protein